jgi:hypothetical protein
VEVAIDLHLLLDLRMVGREKFYEIVAQAADETHGDYERVVSRMEKLEELIARSVKPSYEERVDDAIRLMSDRLRGLLAAARSSANAVPAQ